MYYVTNGSAHFTTVTLTYGPMTLILKSDLAMVKISHHIKNEASISRHYMPNGPTQTDTQADRQRKYENFTFRHTQAVTSPSWFESICILITRLKTITSARA